MEEKIKELSEENKALKKEVEELKQAVKMLKKMYYDLGNRFFDVDKVDHRDYFYEDAFYWYAKAALDENAYAYNMLGSMYHHGYYVKADDEKAIKNYRIAATLGSAEAQKKLGFFYYFGRDIGGIACDVDKNLEESFKWTYMAAMQGDVDAAFAVGMAYLNGLGVEKNLEEAEEWLSFAYRGGREDVKKTLDLIKGTKHK